MEFKGKDAEKVWKDILEYVLENGTEFIDRKKRVCKEVLNIVTSVENPSSAIKPMEVLNKFNRWVYPPLDEIKNSILGKKYIPGYYYNYGARAFDYDGKGLNQIDDYIIPLLKKTPTSKRGIVVFYGPEKDTLPLKKETPCLVQANFNIREGKLHTTVVIRSNDLFFGWPSNIIQTFFLSDYVSKELNVPQGSLNLILISAHIFGDRFEDIKKIIDKK